MMHGITLFCLRRLRLWRALCWLGGCVLAMLAAFAVLLASPASTMYHTKHRYVQPPLPAYLLGRSCL